MRHASLGIGRPYPASPGRRSRGRQAASIEFGTVPGYGRNWKVRRLTTPPRLFLVTHNRNHISIFTDMARLLQAEGHPVTFVVVEGNPDREAAEKTLGERGVPFITSEDLARAVTPRDVVCVGNDWGPKHFKRKLEHFRRRVVPVIGVVEGARFAYPRHWERVDDLLAWGPSALDMLPGHKHIVGSPAIERALKPDRVQPARPHVIVNYKFMKGAKEQGPVWANECAAAAAPIDADYVISAHPFNVGELGGLNVSHAPFSKLLDEATLLITRSSTVIYEALAARVSVIYYPLADERRAEFGEPLGAFGTANNAAELAELVRAHGADPSFNEGGARAFLERHVSFDPAKSASQRMADFVSAKLAERAGIDPAALPGSKPGLAGLLARVFGGPRRPRESAQ